LTGGGNKRVGTNSQPGGIFKVDISSARAVGMRVSLSPAQNKPQDQPLRLQLHAQYLAMILLQLGCSLMQNVFSIPA
jgi:hypothetical protein